MATDCGGTETADKNDIDPVRWVPNRILSFLSAVSEVWTITIASWAPASIWTDFGCTCLLSRQTPVVAGVDDQRCL